MSFIHDDPEFATLLSLVTDETRIGPSLVEKDYWVTHCMWAVHQTGLELWFKGGTSLSKGYGVIQRFSEDLDLMVQHGSALDLPPVTNWTSVNKGPSAARRAFYEALPGAFAIPGVKIEIDERTQDKYARGINLIGRYPGLMLDDIAPTMSPYVLFFRAKLRAKFSQLAGKLGVAWLEGHDGPTRCCAGVLLERLAYVAGNRRRARQAAEHRANEVPEAAPRLGGVAAQVPGQPPTSPPSVRTAEERR